MQIDFHHGVTYIVARKAGFDHHDAQIVAHCAQYVDDATANGTINFNNGAMYARISSAHKMLDYRNFEQLANHQVWIPFHFLPGNANLPSDQNVEGNFIEKIICCPNSPIAQDMVKVCINAKHEHDKYALHRLGITMHVYADTWAHQGFAGVNHDVNNVFEVKEENAKQGQNWASKVGQYFNNMWDNVASSFVSDALPLGHGAVLNYPDLPYLKWSYKNRYTNKLIVRDNPTDFVAAADHMCMAMKRYIAGDANAQVSGLADGDKKVLRKYLEEITDESGEKRHNKWLTLINDDVFGLGSQRVTYLSKGPGSWKDKALGRKRGEVYSYSNEFLTSDWKCFHDALIAHRFDLVHNILPEYEICAA